MKKSIKYIILILVPMVMILFSTTQPVGAQQLNSYITGEVFTVPLYLPEGARIDYLRIYFYDKSTEYNSAAWVTRYNGSGLAEDVAYVTSSGNSGYGQALSAYSGNIVDTYGFSYVLNWRPTLYSPYKSTSDMQLFGLRVAYRLPTGPGTWSDFYYAFFPGVVLSPRASTTSWAGGYGYGSTHPFYYPVYLPLTVK